jgi:hypothetical protein
MFSYHFAVGAIDLTVQRTSLFLRSRPSLFYGRGQPHLFYGVSPSLFSIVAIGPIRHSLFSAVGAHFIRKIVIVLPLFYGSRYLSRGVPCQLSDVILEVADIDYEVSVSPILKRLGWLYGSRYSAYSMGLSDAPVMEIRIRNTGLPKNAAQFTI